MSWIVWVCVHNCKAQSPSVEYKSLLIVVFCRKITENTTLIFWSLYISDSPRSKDVSHKEEMVMLNFNFFIFVKDKVKV